MNRFTFRVYRGGIAYNIVVYAGSKELAKTVAHDIAVVNFHTDTIFER